MTGRCVKASSLSGEIDDLPSTASPTSAALVQAAVDGQAQIIVACGVTQAAADAEQFVPMVEQVAAHTGQLPAAVLADTGYFSESNLTAPGLNGIELYVPPDRQTHGGTPTASGRPRSPTAEQMRAKLRSAAGHAVYALRKAIVEPVFGQIKEVRGFRRFSFRGVPKVSGEWVLICLTHNLLKLFRARGCPQLA